MKLFIVNLFALCKSGFMRLLVLAIAIILSHSPAYAATTTVSTVANAANPPANTLPPVANWYYACSLV